LNLARIDGIGRIDSIAKTGNPEAAHRDIVRRRLLTVLGQAIGQAVIRNI
jgi:hypothetical protein